MPIPFSQIPQTNLTPFYFVEFDNSNTGVAGNAPQNSLLVGQTINAVPATIVYVPSANFAANLFGAGSMLARMAAWYYDADPEGTLYAFPLADAGGSAAATGTFAFAGTATANGTLFLMIGGEEVQVGVTTGQTATQIATACVTAINAFTDVNGMFLPVTATSSTGTVTLTARNKGTVGNTIGLALNFYGSANNESTPAGVTVTVTAMASGATDPDLAGLAAAMGQTNYDFIMIGGYTETTQLNEVQTALSFNGGRWGYAQQLFGHAWTAFQSTAGASGTDLLTFGAGRNDPHTCVIGYEQASPSPTSEVCAAGVGAFAQASKAQPARPEQTLVLPGIVAAPTSSRFGFNTVNTLLSTGIAQLTAQPGGGQQWLRSVTTYQQNSFGQTDRSYLDASVLFMIMFYVRQQKANLTQKFPRAILVQNGTSFGQMANFGTDTPVIVTPNILEAELVSFYTRMCPGGDLPTIVQDPAGYAAGLQVQINGLNPNRADILDDPIFVGGLRMIAVLNQFRLTDPPAGG
jgi:phage tail sheath gpL-like